MKEMNAVVDALKGMTVTELGGKKVEAFRDYSAAKRTVRRTASTRKAVLCFFCAGCGVPPPAVSRSVMQTPPFLLYFPSARPHTAGKHAFG